MTFKKSYVPGILGSVLTLTVIMAAPVKAETKEETILNKTDWSTMAAANVEGYVNIRSEANADSEIVGVLMPGYAVTVTEKGDEWSKISSNGVEGYIKNEYLVFGEEAKAHYRNMCGITGVVQADSLRVREAASTDSAQVGTLTQNGEVSVFGEEADWYQIQYSGSSAYVHGDYVTLSEELKGAVSMEEYQASQACAASSAAAASTAGSASVISADSNDVAMLAALIECEAGGESYTGMVAVGAVVVNRVNSGSFPNSVSGVIYQGGQYKNSHDEGSDKILMNYIAPQIALFYVKQKFNLSLSTGLGYQLYKDKSLVYDKPRNVSMNKLAYNLSAGGEYLFSQHIGISAKVNWIVTSSDSYSVKYHGQKWQVESPELNGGGGCFSQLSLLFGMNFHF